MLEKLIKKYSLILLFLLFIFSSFIKIKRFQISHLEVLKKADIRYTWDDSVSLVDGNKIYERILEGDLIENQKYPVYWPLIYEFSALLFFLGFNLNQYALLTLILTIITELVTVALVYKFLKKQKKEMMGLFFGWFYLFNNYSFYVSGTLQLDIIILSLLTISLLYLKKKTYFSSIIFGLSLAIKQFGFLLIPIYLFNKINLKVKIKSFLFLLIIPFLAALPFLITQPKGFLVSMIFSLIRKADRPGGYALGFFSDYGILSRIPFLLSYLILVFLYYFRKINKYSFGFFCFLFIIFYNPVLFPQYFVYLTSFSILQLVVLPKIKKR
jgi:hypothetical protein